MYVAAYSARCTTVHTERPQAGEERGSPTPTLWLASKAFEMHYSGVHLIKSPVPARCWILGDEFCRTVVEILRDTLATSPERPRIASKTRKVRNSVAPRMTFNTVGVVPCPTIIPSPFLLYSLTRERSTDAQVGERPESLPVRLPCGGFAAFSASVALLSTIRRFEDTSRAKSLPIGATTALCTGGSLRVQERSPFVCCVCVRVCCLLYVQ